MSFVPPCTVHLVFFCSFTLSIKVQTHWVRYTEKMDRMVEEALRLKVQWSLQELSRAINGDGKNTPNPLFRVKVVLEGDKASVTHGDWTYCNRFLRLWLLTACPSRTFNKYWTAMAFIQKIIVGSIYEKQKANQKSFLSRLPSYHVTLCRRIPVLTNVR